LKLAPVPFATPKWLIHQLHFCTIFFISFLYILFCFYIFTSVPSNRSFAQISGHIVQNHILVSKLRSGTSKTKAGPDGLVRVALFWKSHYTTCSLACDFVLCDRNSESITSTQAFVSLSGISTNLQLAAIHLLSWSELLNSFWKRYYDKENGTYRVGGAHSNDGMASKSGNGYNVSRNLLFKSL